MTRCWTCNGPVGPDYNICEPCRRTHDKLTDECLARLEIAWLTSALDPLYRCLEKEEKQNVDK